MSHYFHTPGFLKSLTAFTAWILCFFAVSSCKKEIKVTKGESGSSLKYISSGNHDVVSNVVRTSDGGFLYCGKSGPDTADTQAFLLKLDSLGNTVFYKTYGGRNFDQFFHAIQCSDGSFVAVGSTNSIGKGVTDSNFLICDYVVKTDAGGNELWSKSFSILSKGGGAFTSVVESPDHFFYTTGFDDQTGRDIIFCKFDQNGKKLVYKYLNQFSTYPPNIIQTTWQEYGLNITLGKNGNLLLGGTMNPSSLALQSGDFISFLISITPSGNVDFFYPYYNYIRLLDDYLNFKFPDLRILTQNDGYLIATSFNIRTSKICLQLLKTDLNGEPLWEKKIYGMGSTIIGDVLQLNDGSILVTGSSTSSLLDNSYTEFFSFLKSMVLHIDAGGSVISEHYYGSNDNLNLGKCIRQNPKGGFTLAGYTSPVNSGYHKFFTLNLNNNLEFVK